MRLVPAGIGDWDTSRHDGGMMADTAREPLPGWLLDEVASAGRENLDADHVARYDGKEDASAVEEVALLQRLA